MRSSNSTYDSNNIQLYKNPVYLIKFEDETIDYSNRAVVSSENTVKKYISDISGLSQKVTPEEGKSTIGDLKVTILDVDEEITSLLSYDAYNFQRKRATMKVGYMGMTESEMLTISVGWVTDIKLNRDGTAYIFEITDPQRWMQRKIFRGAEEENITVSGNFINILLQLILSTGNGTNGEYDRYDANWALGLDEDFVNVESIEKVRDNWYPGDSAYVKFNINERIVAKTFFEREFFKVFNLYPTIDADGKFNVKVIKPPIFSTDTVQSFDEDTIIGLPEYDLGFASLKNEFEYHYDYGRLDSGDFGSSIFYVNSSSVNNRGPGTSSYSVKSQGIHSTLSPSSLSARATDIIIKRKNQIFQRYSDPPPIKLKFKTFFQNWLSEGGDVVPFTHSKLPNLEAGEKGLSTERMEIINRSPDWKNGTVTFNLLNTGFKKNQYGVIAPSMIVDKGYSVTSFRSSVTDIEKFSIGDYIDVLNPSMRVIKAGATIVKFTGTTIQVEHLGSGNTPAANWIMQPARYPIVPSTQREFCYISTVTGYLDTSDSPEERFLNGGFENFTGTEDDNTTDTFDNWINYNESHGYIDASRVDPYAGTYCAKIANTDANANSPFLYQNFNVSPSTYYKFEVAGYGDDSYSLMYSIADNTNANYIYLYKNTNTTAAEWAVFQKYFQVKAKCKFIGIYLYYPVGVTSAVKADAASFIKVDPAHIIIS